MSIDTNIRHFKPVIKQKVLHDSEALNDKFELGNMNKILNRKTL